MACKKQTCPTCRIPISRAKSITFYKFGFAETFASRYTSGELATSHYSNRNTERDIVNQQIDLLIRLFILQNPTLNETIKQKLNNYDVSIVMFHANCCPNKAIHTLAKTNGDVLDAIREINAFR